VLSTFAQLAATRDRVESPGSYGRGHLAQREPCLPARAERVVEEPSKQTIADSVAALTADWTSPSRSAAAGWYCGVSASDAGTSVRCASADPFSSGVRHGSGGTPSLAILHGSQRAGGSLQSSVCLVSDATPSFPPVCTYTRVTRSTWHRPGEGKEDESSYPDDSTASLNTMRRARSGRAAS
jgi:hypothetical protein